LDYVDWVYLGQDREGRQAVVQTEVKFLVTKDDENILIS
jgi:hypothetical protein